MVGNKVRITVTLDADVVDAVKRQSESLRRSVSSIVNYALARSCGLITTELGAANDVDATAEQKAS